MSRFFFARFFSSILLWAVVLLVIFWDQPVVFYVVLSFIASLALWEFYDLAARGGMPSFRLWGLAGGNGLVFGSWYFVRHGFPVHVAYDFELLVLMGFVLGVFVRQMPQRDNPKALATMSCTVFGVLYVPWLLSFITKINYGLGEAASGRMFVLYLVIVTKAADVGAYFVGSSFGRHPLIPRISPKKTWEGLLGGVLMSVWTSILMWAVLNSRIPAEFNVRFGVGDATVLGVGMGLVAVAGDLAESLVKREAGAKDSGRLVPGIGGALDLVDSLLFTAPLLFVYMRLVLR